MAGGALPLYRGAAVGPETRAYQQSGGLNSFTRSPAGTVAVGAATRAARLGLAGPGARPGPAAAPTAAPGGVPGAVPAAGAGAAVWTPPPTGSYNPTRDVEAEEGERGLGQLEGQLATSGSRDTADYFTQKGEIERTEGQQNTDFSKQQEQLAEAFKQLAGSQQEGANKAGVLGGGALLQAAAKRAVNEGKERATDTTNHERQIEGDELAQAKLAREGAPPETANPLGGRAFQDLNTQLTNAQSNQTFFEDAQHRLAGQEASERGYNPPAAPAAPHVAPSGLPVVKSSRAQPVSRGVAVKNPLASLHRRK